MNTRNLDLIKWLAFAAMVADHSARLLDLDAPGLVVLGRIALPLFAALVAVHAAYHTRSMLRYAGRLLGWGCIAQVAFLAAGWPYLNILVTLGLGVLLCLLCQQGGRSVALAILGAFAAVTLLAGHQVIDGGFPALCVVLGVYLARDHRGWWLLALVGLALLNAWRPGWVAAWSILGSAGVWALAAFLPDLRWRAAGPRWLWYAAYPVHLLVLVGLGVWS